MHLNHGTLRCRNRGDHLSSQHRFIHLFGYDSELNLNQQGFASEYGDSGSNVVSLDDARVKRQS
ncbi:hypothetical protein, partial [Vibrio metschnikovii]|uniref:hypothetical protein n=1 Tax=Vibrio metschnikovii TaxID=28172 RepID=UPI002FCA7C86